MAKKIDYDVEIDEIKLEEDTNTRDNILAIQRSILKIQEIINDLDRRVSELE